MVTWPWTKCYTGSDSSCARYRTSSGAVQDQRYKSSAAEAAVTDSSAQHADRVAVSLLRAAHHLSTYIHPSVTYVHPWNTSIHRQHYFVSGYVSDVCWLKRFAVKIPSAVLKYVTQTCGGKIHTLVYVPVCYGRPGQTIIFLPCGFVLSSSFLFLMWTSAL